MIGAVLGGILGQLIPYDLEGIDFCMTALFVIIFIDQWEKNKNHLPALLGIVVSIVALAIFGQSNFMLAALVAASGILLLLRGNEVETK
jgi:4-azaleucine resistance transporter AzlC